MSEQNHDATVASSETPYPGGNITLSPGKGKPDGSIVLKLADNTEAMRFDGDGKIFVRGEQVDDNAEVYAAFRWWLRFAIARDAAGVTVRL